MKSWIIQDVVAYAKGYRYTFYTPSETLLKTLEVGDFVKLMFLPNNTTPQKPLFNSEKLWVRVTEINDTQLSGIIDNKVDLISDLKKGDLVQFGQQHILNIYGKIEEGEDITERYQRGCIANHLILDGKHPVQFLFRKKWPGLNDETFSGWHFLCGYETKKDQINPTVTSLASLLNRDDRFIDLLDAPYGSSFYWDREEERFLPYKSDEKK